MSKKEAVIMLGLFISVWFDGYALGRSDGFAAAVRQMERGFREGLGGISATQN